MTNLSYILSRIPIGLFLLTVINHFVVSYMVSWETYETLYYYISEVMNTSLVANIFMVLVVYRYKLCLYNKVSVYALLSLNLLNIFFLVANFDYDVYELYSQIYMNVVMVPTAILAVILYIKGI